MSFTIKHGLFRANIIDYHAILGVALDAEPKSIRTKYLRTTQKLHPDTCKASAEEKKMAGKILSNLVNPAYEKLSNKNAFAEHHLVLTQIGKRYAENQEGLSLSSDSAQKLLGTKNDLEKTYLELLKEQATDQYKDISKVLKKIAIISELNLAYLVRKHDQGINRAETTRTSSVNTQTHASKPDKTKTTVSGNSPTDKTSKSTEDITSEPRVVSYLRRAKEYMEKSRINDAVSELRDGLRVDPNNSTCHALLGQAYIRQNQLTMAKIHIKKAQKANSKDPAVLVSQEMLEKLTRKQQVRQSGAKQRKKDKSTDGSFFGSLFGARKGSK